MSITGRPLRVLVVAWAWSSHYLPLVPTLWALRADGHDVRVASQQALRSTVVGSGAVFVEAGEDVDHPALRTRVLGDLDFATVPPAPPPGRSADFWDDAERSRVARVFATFAARADLMVDATLEFAREFRPDVVMFEPTSYAGPLVAAALGVPAVRHLHGVDMTYQAREVIPALAAPIAARIGVDWDRVSLLGDLTIDQCPPSMQIPTVANRTVIRYIPYNGPAAAPAWLSQQPDRPRIAITWGATATAMGGEFLPARVADVLADLDVEVVIAVGAADRDLLSTLPPNATVVESLALHLLLPSCRLVIHQGGFGTTLTAADAGVAQIVLPQFPDQVFGAERVASTGAGAVLPARSFTPDAIRSLVLDALDERDDTVSDAVTRLQAEIRSQPTPIVVSERLEKLVHDHDSSTTPAIREDHDALVH